MKIEEVRPSFTVYLIASDLESISGLSESLSLAGYMVATFAELTAAFSELYSNPPHFVIFEAGEKLFNLNKAIEQVLGQLPESHIFLLTDIAERARATTYLSQGVYDLIFTPVVSEVELVRTLDRAAERDYFMYLNERLMQSQEPPAPKTDVNINAALFENTASEVTKVDDSHLDFAPRLFHQTTAEDGIKTFLEAGSRALGSAPALYFRYVSNRRVLMLAQHYAAANFNLKGLGINFNEVAPGFRTVQLREPMRIAEFTGMIQDVFRAQQFVAWPLEALGELQGVICFLAMPNSELLDQTLREWLGLLSKALSLIESERRLHVASIRDVATEALNRQTFMTKVTEEISRARRTRMPVSLVQIAVDQYGHLTSVYGPEEAQVVLRTVAQILQKHSRVNDIIGRTGADEFGLLLPHTNKEGAMIKAERLRRIFESADFTKVLRGFGRLTVSLGVSEYPALARDAEELIQSSDEALFQVRKPGNKTCVGTAPEGFEPDFVVTEKGS